MNVKTPIEGANSLTKNALDHCIFPITTRDDIQKYGPMIMASGSGVNVVDIHGKTYLDMMGSSSRANSLGYGNEEIARAMYEQAKTLHYIGSGRNVTEPMIRLATRIAELAPGRLSKVMFVSGGSEAVETAFKIAKQYQSGERQEAERVQNHLALERVSWRDDGRLVGDRLASRCARPSIRAFLATASSATRCLIAIRLE